MRTEVFYRSSNIDGRAKKILASLKEFVSSSIDKVSIVDVFITDNIKALDPSTAGRLFADPVSQIYTVDDPAADNALLKNWDLLIEITYKTGVSNPIDITIKETIESALGQKLEKPVVQNARQFLIKYSNKSEINEKKIKKYLHNSLIERAELITKEDWNKGKRLPDVYPHKVKESSIEVMKFDIADMKDPELVDFSRKRLLSLNLEEMTAIKDYYKSNEVIENRKKNGLNEKATDVELEMIAQTWSEHCKHKILNAKIDYKEGDKKETIKSLFKEYIKETTDILSKEKKYLKSVFHDDSGVIDFDGKNLVCFKVETHNSPSALDPYGGAITGIVGVNRDIIGTGRGAKPIFNTNVLCFGDPNTDESEIPEGLLHPRRVMSGVHHGIIDGGNQSGIPVVGGAFVFDDSYIGKPLVFCGTGGILPAKVNGEDSWVKHVNPGYKAVMIGGKIGKDGIHGATFSSQALDEESPTSAVQIGDPITQKKLLDFLLEARDKGLYRGGTDNGAGGLSSSLGEMAELAGGIVINLDKCPLKYQGLAPWEILVSESQERMSLAVPENTLEEFMSLAAKRDVEASVVGVFTDSGDVNITYKEKTVGLLSLEFLHDGLPQMHLEAEWNEKKYEKNNFSNSLNLNEELLKVLSDPTVASKEKLVRQYDHEVQGKSVLKPFIGKYSDAPSDGAVLKPLFNSDRGLTVTHGICQRISDDDTYNMAMCAVDEAYRAHIACGGDPEYTSALDNFCWPDPEVSKENPDGKYKLAQLVRACKGLKKACLDYGIPLISGKDSMKNDARLGGKKVSVRPTLLVSLMGIIKDIKKTMSSDFKNAGDIIFLAGKTTDKMGGSTFEKINNTHFGESPSVDTGKAKELYKSLHNAIEKGFIESCHDISDGGLATAIAESCLGGRLGADINVDNIADFENEVILFSESPSRFLLSTKAENRENLVKTIGKENITELGTVTEKSKLAIKRNNKKIINLAISKIEKAWKSL